MREMGLVLYHHHLLYGWKHGFGCGWLPRWVQHAIVHVFNWTTCRLFGHDVLDLRSAKEFRDRVPVCVACCKEFPGR